MSHSTGLIILLSWAAFLVFITISAFFVKRTVELARGWRWSWLIPLLIAAVLFLFEHFRHPSFHWTRIALPSPPPIVGGAADLLVVAGLVIALWGRVVLGRNWNLRPGLKENHELIERGPYACVRHPMYSGLCLMLLGTVISYGNKAGLLLFFAGFLGPWFKLRQEEKILTIHFGDSYLKYKARVKALIPFVF
jgi:protein-S-isoprenylcysteine O-methyltransferase Ste14